MLTDSEFPLIQQASPSRPMVPCPHTPGAADVVEENHPALQLVSCGSHSRAPTKTHRTTWLTDDGATIVIKLFAKANQGVRTIPLDLECR